MLGSQILAPRRVDADAERRRRRPLHGFVRLVCSRRMDLFLHTRKRRPPLQWECSAELSVLERAGNAVDPNRKSDAGLRSDSPRASRVRSLQTAVRCRLLQVPQDEQRATRATVVFHLKVHVNRTRHPAFVIRTRTALCASRYFRSALPARSRARGRLRSPPHLAPCRATPAPC